MPVDRSRADPPPAAGRALPLDKDAPLSVHERFPGCRVKLVCGSCTWSKSYDPARIIRRLEQKGRGDARTPISAVAQQVQWPCPACRRMRWGSVLVTG